MGGKKAADASVLKNAARGEVVELPPFLDGQPFTARLRKPSLLRLAATGVIPNPLLAAAERLFGGKVTGSAAAFKETAEVFHIIADAALIEPTLEQIEDAGAELTDMQQLAIFNYTQMGARALEGFRRVPGGTAADSAE